MKVSKFLTSVLFVAALAIGFTACDDKNKNGGVNDPFGNGGNENNGGGGTPGATLTVAEALTIQDGETYTVNGYIVAALKQGVSKYSDPSEIEFSNFTGYNAIFIADSKTETDPAKLLCVKLNDTESTECGVKGVVNLKDNPSNLGKQLSVTGRLKSVYTSLIGLRAVTAFTLEGYVYVDPSEGAFFFESFTESLGDFTVINKVIPEGLTNIWSYDSKYKCAKATGFSGTKKDATGWLVSPVINLSEKSSATLSFSNAGNYFVTPAEELQVYISTTSDGTSFDTGWTMLTIDKYSNGNFVWATSTISLNSYCGNANVRIAFKYYSTPEMCGTWEIKDLAIK